MLHLSSSTHYGLEEGVCESLPRVTLRSPEIIQSKRLWRNWKQSLIYL
jgi:hypothetical protein